MPNCYTHPIQKDKKKKKLGKTFLAETHKQLCRAQVETLSHFILYNVYSYYIDHNQHKVG